MEYNLKLLDEQLRALESQYIHQEAHAAQVLIAQVHDTLSTQRPSSPPPSPRPHLPLQRMLLNAQVHGPIPQPPSPPGHSLSFSVPAALPEDAARLQTGRALEQPPPGVRSTWEGQRAQALLELEQQLHQLEQKVRLQAAAHSSGGTPQTAVGPEGKENQDPPSMGIKNTLRPSTLEQPSKFYPEQQQREPTPAHAPLQIAQPPPPKLAPPWEVGGELGPWEYRKGVALLALEQERNALANQLEAYSRIDQVHAQKMREVHEKHANQLEAYARKEDEVQEMHAEALKDASGMAGRKLERLYKSAAAAYAARRLAKHLARALAWWHFEAVRSRRLAWALRVWNNRTLETAFLAWLQLRWEARQRPEAQCALQHACLHAWSNQAQASARARRLLHRAQLQQTRRLLHAWQARAERWQQKRGALQRAEARFHRSLAKRVMVALASQLGWELEALRQLMAMCRVIRLRLTLQGWFTHCALSKRAARMARRGRLRCALRQWSRAVCAAVAIAEHAELKAQATRQKLKVDSIRAWHNVAVLRVHRRWAEGQIATRVRATQLHTVMHHWHVELRVSSWAAARKKQMLRGALLAWEAWGKRRRRLSRLAGSAAAHRLQGLLSAALGEWRVLGACRRARLLGVDLTKMQACVASVESEVVSSRAHAHAHLVRARAAACELQLLREEAMRVSGLMGHGGPTAAQSFDDPPATPSTSPHFQTSSRGMDSGACGLFGASLSWCSLPPDPDHPQAGTWSGVRARGRHAAIWLPEVQAVCVPQTLAHLQTSGQLHTSGQPQTSGQGGHGEGVKRVLAGQEQAAEGEGLVSSGVRLAGLDSSRVRLAEGSVQVGREGDAGAGAQEEVAMWVDDLVKPWDARTPVPALSGVVLVFGGISGEVWLADLQAVTIVRAEDLSTRVSCKPVALDTRLLPQGQLRAVRDSACCACGPSSFVAIGGFDGQKETMDMLVFRVKASCAPKSAPSLSATVELLQPRSIRSPIGRSHHTATYHAPSRSILVFGGYSSAAGGHLNELWVFSMDLMEWIQPDITGDWPPARRGHVAAVGHDDLYIYGGFNGSKHWGGVWCLDLRRWHWEQLPTQGPAPTPCRGHAAAMLEQRHLLVHGGFDGARHLGQVRVLDTHTRQWSKLQVGGQPDDTPAPRAMHTLTPAGPFCLLLGGCGPLGPLPGLHLLESPSAVAGIVQQHRLAGLANRLSRATSECGRLQARLTIAEHEAAQGKEQLQAVHERSAALVARHNAVCEDVSALRAALAHEQRLTAGAQAAMQEAQLAAAAAERRLQRARQGGQEVAEAAQGLHLELEDAHAQVAALQSQMHSLQADCAAAQASAHQVAAERTVLHTQLASANNEVTLLRSMLGSVRGLQAQHEQQQQQRQQQQQQQEQQEQVEQQQLLQHQGQELAGLKQELQEVRSREAALQQQLAAARAATQSQQQQEEPTGRVSDPSLGTEQRPTQQVPDHGLGTEQRPTQQIPDHGLGTEQRPTQQIPDHGLGTEQQHVSRSSHPAPEPAGATVQAQAQVHTKAEPATQQEGHRQGPPGPSHKESAVGAPRMLMTAEGGAVPLQAVHASVHELAQAHARAMTSELQLIMMEKDYAALKGEVAALSAGIQKERGAAQADREKARAAVEQLHKMETHYVGLLEGLDSQLRAERVQRWQQVAGQEAQRSVLQAPHQPAIQRLPPPPSVLPSAPQSSQHECVNECDALIDSSRLGGVQVSDQGDAAGRSEMTGDPALLPETAALLDLRHTLL